MGESEKCLKHNFGKFRCVDDYVVSQFTTSGRSTVNRLCFTDVSFKIVFILNVMLG